MILYLQGSPLLDGEHIQCPLSSSVILFIIRYCQTKMFKLVFVPDSNDSISMCCTLNRHVFSDLSVTFTSWTEVPQPVRNVSLPALFQPELSIIRSGLCVLLRHIIKESHASSPHLYLIDLLGFRQGSMKMCAEVSGFTKLCEVELPQAVSDLMCNLKDLCLQKEDKDKTTGAREVIVPSALIKLDCHFLKKCRVHNDNKRRREELARMKKYFSESFKNQTSLNKDKTGKDITSKVGNIALEETVLVQNCGDHMSLKNNQSLSDDNFTPLKHSAHICSGNESFRIEVEKPPYKDSRLQIDHVAQLHHGIRRLTVDKNFDFSLEMRNGRNINCDQKLMNKLVKVDASTSTKMKLSDCQNITDFNPDLTTAVLADIAELVDKLTYLDVKYEHTYSEGIEMTLADLILYVYAYHLLEAIDFSCVSLTYCIPSVLQWAGHMTSLSTVVSAGQRSGWNMETLAVCLKTSCKVVSARECSDALPCSKDVMFVKEVEVVEDDDEMELSRCARMKHKALKPEVTQALHKFEEANIKPVTGNHPCGDHVDVDWGCLPADVHPREGDVPETRTQRKCQQLENLVTAVQKLARAGNILVDFCSGGGHLGIVMAYLLPDCQIFLVENKEESLLKACSRLEALGLRNVTMYQCNLAYFNGSFDVGVCLHACGSATDMVLQLCLNSCASFVICPCCYGSIQKTHLLSYPQSKMFMEADITYKDFLTLGHAADQTEFNIALEEQGHQCMNLVDTDRAEHARELGYNVTLCSLKPLSCTPKNNLLIGTFNKE